MSERSCVEQDPTTSKEALREIIAKKKKILIEYYAVSADCARAAQDKQFSQARKIRDSGLFEFADQGTIDAYDEAKRVLDQTPKLEGRSDEDFIAKLDVDRDKAIAHMVDGGSGASFGLTMIEGSAECSRIPAIESYFGHGTVRKEIVTFKRDNKPVTETRYVISWEDSDLVKEEVKKIRAKRAELASGKHE